MMTRKYLNLRFIIILTLYIIGLLHWCLFLNYGKPAYIHTDWPWYYQSIDVLKQFFVSGDIPYHATLFAGDTIDSSMFGSARFFSNPYVPVMVPQVFLLKFISVKAFMTFQLLLFYSISFLGVCLWIKKLNLATSSAVFLLILFHFSGNLTSRVGGQTMQMTLGHMLIPLFYWIIYKLIEKENVSRHENIKWMLGLSFFFLLLLMNEGIHVFYQMALVGFSVLVFYYKRIVWFIGGASIAAVYNTCFILPVLLTNDSFRGAFPPADHWRHSGIYGYGFQNGDSGVPLLEYSRDMPEVKQILTHSINILNHLWESLTHSFNAAHINVWEYNLYVSYLGVLLIVGSMVAVFLKYRPFGKNTLKQYRYLLGTMIVFMLAIGTFNRIMIQALQSIKMFNPIDAIPSRLMNYPFTLTILIASLSFDNMFKIFPDKVGTWAKWSALSVLLAILMKHSYSWWLVNAQADIVHSLNDWNSRVFKTVIYNNVNDSFYKRVVNISYISSIITISCGGIYYLRLIFSNSGKKRIKDEGQKSL